MSRHSKTLDLELADGYKIRIGDKEPILTSNETGDGDRLPVRELYVDRATGRLVIVYDDLEE